MLDLDGKGKDLDELLNNDVTFLAWEGIKKVCEAKGINPYSPKNFELLNDITQAIAYEFWNYGVIDHQFPEPDEDEEEINENPEGNPYRMRDFISLRG